jgi:hypothetical protein
MILPITGKVDSNTADCMTLAARIPGPRKCR